MEVNNGEDLSLLKKIVSDAGKVAMKYFKSENEVWMKPGNSPVSQGDLAVNEYLHKHLLAARPDYGWLSEETEDDGSRLDRKRVFMVDPIDGTRGYIKGLNEWCISVAIIEDGRPVVAVLECPALGETYTTKANDNSYLNGETIAVSKAGAVRSATASHKINDAMASELNGQVEVVPFVPSLAYRIAKVAAGNIDLALARPGAQDWDLAAVDLIVTNAGGQLTGLNFQALQYNRQKLRHDSLIACSTNLQNPALELANCIGILH